MKKIKWVLLLLVTIGATQIFAQADTKEEMVVPLSSPGKPYKLHVDQLNGSIEVIGYAGKDILIEVTSDETKTRARRGDSLNGMRRISAGKGYEVQAREKDNAVTVNNSGNARNLKLTLKIPQDVKLKLATVNNGDITVDNLKGELEITNVNGPIRATNISGSVVANTVNGRVLVTFLSVDAKSPMAFSTLNGNVDITLPAATAATVKMKSEGGQIYSDFDMIIDPTSPVTKKTNERGMYKLEKEDWVHGKINGGGVEMMMTNMNGQIFVRKAK